MRWKSIIQQCPDRSYFGRFGTLQKHHCLHGPYRTKAEQDGLYVMLTVQEHRDLHDKGINDLELKMIAERAWLDKYGNVDDFIKRYGRNFL